MEGRFIDRLISRGGSKTRDSRWNKRRIFTDFTSWSILRKAAHQHVTVSWRLHTKEKKSIRPRWVRKERGRASDREKMNYATNRKMLVTMELEAIVLYLLSVSLFRSIFFRFSTPPRQREEGREEEENEKKPRAMICSDPCHALFLLPMDRPSLCFALSPPTSPIGYTAATKPHSSSSSFSI